MSWVITRRSSIGLRCRARSCWALGHQREIWHFCLCGWYSGICRIQVIAWVRSAVLYFFWAMCLWKDLKTKDKTLGLDVKGYIESYRFVRWSLYCTLRLDQRIQRAGTTMEQRLSRTDFALQYFMKEILSNIDGTVSFIKVSCVVAIVRARLGMHTSSGCRMGLIIVIFCVQLKSASVNTFSINRCLNISKHLGYMSRSPYTGLLSAASNFTAEIQSRSSDTEMKSPGPRNASRGVMKGRLGRKSIS